jgi:acetyltransferase
MVLLAEDKHGTQRHILGVGRLNKLHARNEAEVAVLVADEYQNRGLGAELLRRVIGVARDEKLSQLSAEILRENVAMQVVLKRLGFRLQAGADSTSIQAVLKL